MTPDVEEFLEIHNVPEKYGPRLYPIIRDELAEYSDEEFFTVDLIYLWQKGSY